MGIQYKNLLANITLGLTIIYNMEAFIKLVGLGKFYFHENWNIFDFTIVIMSDIGILLTVIWEDS